MCCVAAGSLGGCDSKSFKSNDTSEIISALEFLSEGQLSRFNPHSSSAGKSELAALPAYG